MTAFVEYGFTSSALPEVTWVMTSLRIVEELGRPYRIQLELYTEALDTDLTQLLGRNSLVEITRGEETRRFCGIVLSVEEGHTRDAHLATYLEIVPAMFLLGMRRNTRIFQGQTVPEILDVVLNESLGPYNRSIQADLSGEYLAREYCVQYEETDLAFAQRLMEEEGITYSFSHEGGEELTLLTDANTAFPQVASDDDGVISYSPNLTDSAAPEAVHAFHVVDRATTTSVVVRDFDWTRGGDMKVEAEVRGEDDAGHDRESYEHRLALTITDYDSGVEKYQAENSEGQAQLRHEGHVRDARVGRGISRVIGFGAGTSFDLVGHPGVGLDDSYVLTRVIHELAPPPVAGEAEATSENYHNRFECIPAAAAYRPDRLTPKPRIHSSETAVVTGPSGEEIHTDEHGRIKVQFHWDREGQKDENSSCWLRVSQAWAGAGWGFVFLPRIGMEVIVTFLGGDPDRPLVTGCVYDGTNRPPYKLPDEKTKSTIKSNSSVGGGGFNEIRFEDKAGSEQIYTHAQKDQDEEVEHNHTTWVGGSQWNTVDGNQTQTIGGNQTEHVKKNQKMTVDIDRTVHVLGNFDETVDGTETRQVGGDVTEDFGANETRTVAANQDETYGGNQTITVGGSRSETIGGNVSQTIGGSVTETIGGSVTETIGGSVTALVGGSVAATVGGSVTNTVGGAVTFVAAGGYTVIAPAGAKIIAPGGTTTIDSYFDNHGAKSAEYFGIKQSFVAVQNDNIGLVNAFTGIKIDNTMLALENKGAFISCEGVDLEKPGVSFKTGAIAALTFGLKIL